MHINTLAALIVGTASMAFSVTAASAQLSVLPNDFPAGTDISIATPGVTLSAITGTGLTTEIKSIYAVDCAPVFRGCAGIPGPNVFGTRWTDASGNISYNTSFFGYNFFQECVASGWTTPELCWGSFTILRAEFLKPAAFVSIVGSYHGGPGDPPAINAYDAAGQSVDYDLNWACAIPTYCTLSVSSPTATISTIAYVVAAGLVEWSILTDLTFDVPEASVLLEELATDATGAGPGKSLRNKVELVQAYHLAGDNQSACAALANFDSSVENFASQKKPKLSLESAMQLTTEAELIAAVIGCN